MTLCIARILTAGRRGCRFPPLPAAALFFPLAVFFAATSALAAPDKIPPTPFVKGGVIGSPAASGSPAAAQTETAISIEELSRILTLHQPKAARHPGMPSDCFEREAALVPNSDPTRFLIPGFDSYGCGQCHKPEVLVQKAVETAQHLLVKLRETFPGITQVPLRQYIIQPYADEFLKPRQFAHATFDTIRLFPRTLIVDAKVYRNATQQHELLHLAQPFLGHVNELEAYGLNARSDPRFLLLNYPYFANVIGAFHLDDFDSVLKNYFARDSRENLNVPQETQWYMMPFDPDALARLQRAITAIVPLLDAVSRINREFPLQAAYLSEQTGIASLFLDIAAARSMQLPEVDLPEEAAVKAFEVLATQLGKTDNTRLGYVIDRGSESRMAMQHQLSLTNSRQRLLLYFHYLKRRYVKTDGSLDLTPRDREDFRDYVERKLADVRKMLAYPGITPLEKEAGTRFLETIQKQLPAALKE